MGEPKAKDFSIVIPAYNEGERLPDFLKALVREVSKLPFSGEVIIVDDGSRPEHRAQYQQAIDKLNTPLVRLITTTHNQGKGAAIRRGFSESTASWVGFADADGATPASEVARLLGMALSSQGLSGIFGSRVYMLGYKIDRKVSRHLMGRVFVTLTHFLLGYVAYDSQCGCKFFRRRDITPLLSLCAEKGYLLDIELIALGLRRGLHFLEVPIRWTDIPGSKVSVIKDGIGMFLGLWRIRRRLRVARPVKG
jgi:glycosyltransferase involved in cell wall biosynthesis